MKRMIFAAVGLLLSAASFAQPAPAREAGGATCMAGIAAQAGSSSDQALCAATCYNGTAASSLPSCDAADGTACSPINSQMACAATEGGTGTCYCIRFRWICIT